MLTQSLPGDLRRASHERHYEFPFTQTEQNTADYLPGSLPALLRGLFEGSYLTGMLEDLVRDTEFFQCKTGWGFFIHILF